MKSSMHFAALVTSLALAACGRSESPKPTQAPAVPTAANTLSILATSDLRDLEPIAANIEKATGVQVSFKFGGTFESTEAVQADTAKTDAAWFAASSCGSTRSTPRSAKIRRSTS